MSRKSEIEKLPYRRGVGVVLFNAQGRVFVAQRLDTTEPAWQFPQGGIDKDEDPLVAARRELREETGVTSAELIAETPDWLRYDLPRELVPKVWKGRYRGQEQKWFAFRFTGDDSEIRIDGEHPEFSAWAWMKLSETPSLIVAFKRPLYDQVVAAFRHLAA
ncbi:putative (di)nucleoside polyphosphate hydrolase [Dongia mobilis]|uniref:RNA pyrophosphohydrolase n=1 Tax=Dongia mobilis TaxID=578943 RepID=A0A4R6WVD7_9PROT|nr:RNA pyrophosphohydrolase [Dongia mobilis]TDQ83984.1 putative (di)nucleoside polyphosphate hydrolase [Dongia mobilis]